MFCPLLPSLLHGRRRRTNAKMLKIHRFLWVASHMRLFSGSARSNQISEGTRSKKRLNISSKMRTQGTNIDVQKKHFLRPKWLPKWTPKASRNVCTRWSATEAAKNASWGAPRAPPDDFGAIFLPHRYPRIIRGLSNTPNFAHLGPWERTIIKEIDLKQLKHRIRHASGRWPGEF